MSLEVSGLEMYPAGRPQRVLALIGNPNVGKSTLFNSVTGLDVITAHYAGKTPDVNVSTIDVDGVEISLVDAPGTYGIGATGDEAWVARRTLLDVQPDAIIVVLDATNLGRNLALGLEVLDLGMPTVFALNLTDESARAGLVIDVELLSALVGVPVIETVAVEGLGVSELMSAAVTVTRDDEVPRHRYGEPFERALAPLIASIQAMHARPFGLPPRSVALQLIEGHRDIEEVIIESGYAGLPRVAEEARRGLAAVTGEPPQTALARERHGAAGVIADRCTSSVPQTSRRNAEEILMHLSTRASTGVPLLVGLLLGLFGMLFFVGESLARGVSWLWGVTGSPAITALVTSLFGEGALSRSLLWGFDAGIEASLAIGIPFILTFYFMLAVLEDSGYLNAVAFLADRLMHRFGLHGRAIIPLVTGAGCSVPAILAVRMLPSKRERFVASTLVSMVPCSARSAVVLGAVGAFVGIVPALGVFAVTTLVIGLVGVVLNKMLPGAPAGMVMEMFPFRRPRLAVVAHKAWMQFREFVFVAVPLVVVGSIGLGAVYEMGWLERLSAPMEPLMGGLLGLPAFAGLTLLFGLLRKEFALELLVTLAIATGGASAAAGLGDIMTGTDIFVYALVNTLAMPCISTVAVLSRTVGWKRTGAIMGITISVALIVGAISARVAGFAQSLLG